MFKKKSNYQHTSYQYAGFYVYVAVFINNFEWFFITLIDI